MLSASACACVVRVFVLLCVRCACGVRVACIFRLAGACVLVHLFACVRMSGKAENRWLCVRVCVCMYDYHIAVSVKTLARVCVYVCACVHPWRGHIVCACVQK